MIKASKKMPSFTKYMFRDWREKEESEKENSLYVQFPCLVALSLTLVL